MKVSELIEKLKKHPQEFEIILSVDNISGDSITTDVDRVECDSKMGNVYLGGTEQ